MHDDVIGSIFGLSNVVIDHDVENPVQSIAPDVEKDVHTPSEQVVEIDRIVEERSVEAPAQSVAFVAQKSSKKKKVIFEDDVLLSSLLPKKKKNTGEKRKEKVVEKKRKRKKIKV